MNHKSKVKKITGSFVPAQGSKALTSTLKRKAEGDLDSDEPKSKEIRASFGPTPEIPAVHMILYLPFCVRFGFIIQKAGQKHFIHLVIKEKYCLKDTKK